MVAESHVPIANLFPKNPILLDDVFDRVLLMLVHPTSDRDHHKVQRTYSRMR
jgi:hypothetical protein